MPDFQRRLKRLEERVPEPSPYADLSYEELNMLARELADDTCARKLNESEFQRLTGIIMKTPKVDMTEAEIIACIEEG